MTLQVEPTKSCQKRDPTMESREKESGVALDRFKPASSGGRPRKKETFIKGITGLYSSFPFLSSQHYSPCVVSLLSTTIRAISSPIVNVPCISLKSTCPNSPFYILGSPLAHNLV